MASVKRHLSDINKVLKKSQRTVLQIISDIDDEILELMDSKVYENGRGWYYPDRILERVRELLSLKEELKKQAETEQIKRDLAEARLNTARLKQDLQLLCEYFTDRMRPLYNEYGYIMNEVYTKQNVIDDEIHRANEIYADSFELSEYEQMYYKAFKDLQKIYGQDKPTKAQKKDNTNRICGAILGIGVHSKYLYDYRKRC